MQGNRNDRLAADFYEMLKIQDRQYLSWIASKGEPPYAEEYLLTVRLRTYALSTVNGAYTVGAIDKCVVKISLWGSYPQVAPDIRMLNIPPVFHPCWYSKGTYCPAEPWRAEDSLKDHVLKMLMTLKYEPSAADIVSPANYKALEWFSRNRDKTEWFPSDATELSENSPEGTAALKESVGRFEETVDTHPLC